MSGGLRMDVRAFLRDMDSFQRRKLYAIETYGTNAAREMETYAKAQRPWQDRTGMARNLIKGEGHWTGPAYRISLQGNVYYHVYLEMAHEKRYSIIYPTLEQYRDKILRDYARMIARR